MYGRHEVASKATGTWMNHGYHMQSIYIPYFGKDTMLHMLSTPDMERFKAHRLQQVKPSTVNRDIMELNALFEAARKWGHVKINPVKNVTRLKIPKSAPKFYTIDEIASIFDAAKSSKDGQLHLLIVIGIYTGLRINEMIRLTWSDCDMARRVINVAPGKTYVGRVVPMHAEVHEALRASPRHFGEDRIFWTVSIKWGDNTFRKRWGRFQEKHGIKKLRIHDLRHTFASQLAMAGEDLYTVAQLMGHKDVKMTQVYAHLSPEHNAAAISRLDFRRHVTSASHDGDGVAENT